jgi:TorA maturation chaperone TorD
MDLDWPSVARLRQGLYRFYAGALLSPTPQRVRELAAAAEFLDASGIEAFAFAGSWRQIRGVLEPRPTSEELRSDYIRLFVAAPGGPSCPPVESYYAVTNASGSAALLIGELERIYRRIGLELASGGAVTVDHVSTELEAMAHLCRREASAREDLDERTVGEILRTSLAFLNRHLGRWLPVFGQRVHETAPQSFYAVVTRAAAAFVRHDLDLLSACLADRPQQRPA